MVTYIEINVKIIINENQLKQIIESENKKKLLSIPIELFYNKMDSILNNYRKKGFNGIKLVGNVKFYSVDFDRIFEHIVEIDGNLDVSHSKITSLGNLKSVGSYLDLENTPIESLGSLEYVGGGLIIVASPLSELSDKEIRSQVKIKGSIYR